MATTSSSGRRTTMVNCECRDDINYLTEDYQTLYNTSLTLYSKCVKKADYYMDLFDNEQLVSDMMIEKLQLCENKSTSLSKSINYTNLIMAQRENIELKSDLLTLHRQKEICERDNNLSLNLIADYKKEILLLKGNLSSSINQIYLCDNELTQCNMKLDRQIKYGKTVFENLSDCLEREEVIQEKKDKYVLRLTTCRKNNRSLKSRLAE